MGKLRQASKMGLRFSIVETVLPQQMGFPIYALFLLSA
jgi:hypothetical protein